LETIKTREELLQQISATIGKTKVIELSDILYNKRFDIHDLMQLTFYPEKEIAFRAAWILENLVLTDPERFINDLDKLTGLFLKVENKSCQRHYVKILMHLTGPKVKKTIEQKMAGLNMEPIAERCFDLLIDQTTPIAVKAFASQLLFNLKARYPWINDILADQLTMMMPGAKPAIRSTCKRLLDQLT
jgi:hypothetical protein